MVATPAPYVAVLAAGDTVPAVALRDQRGRPFTFAGGQTTILSFIYTRCPDARICPLTAAKFARLQGLIGAQRIRLVTLTVDPGYDTVPILARYAAAFGADSSVWSLVTGPVATVDAFAARFGANVVRSAAGAAAHEAFAVIIDSENRVGRRIDGAMWEPGEALAAAREAAGTAPSAWMRLTSTLAASAAAICGPGRRSPLTVGAALAILASTCVILAAGFMRAFRAPLRP